MSTQKLPHQKSSSKQRKWAIMIPLLLMPVILALFFLSLQSTQTIQAAPEATITVDTTTDDMTTNGNCTLREAIEAANTNTAVDNCTAGSVGEDTIVLSNQIYILSLGGTGEDANQTGDLDILESVIIEGNGATIDGEGIDRVIHVDPNYEGLANLTLDNVTVDNGAVTGNGGGILVEQGRVALLNSTIMNNAASGVGGGMYVETGYIYLLNSTISDNTADEGGGIYSYAGVLDIVDSQLEHNEATSSDGGAIHTYGGNVHLNNSELYSNTASGDGGAIYSNYGLIELNNNSSIRANMADYGGGLLSDGGGTFIYDSAVTDNIATYEGGGIVSNGDDYGGIIMVNSTLSSNSALDGEGGGLYVYEYGGAILENTLVNFNNASEEGGGIYHYGYGTVYLDGSTVYSNTTQTDGGAIFADSYASVVLIDSTLESNRAQQNGGGVYMDSDGALTIQDSTILHNRAMITGGAIYLDDDLTTLIQSSSIINNDAQDGGAIGTGTGNGAIVIENSTIGENSASNSGGAIFTEGQNMQISLNQTTLVANSATTSGAAFYLAGTAGVVVQNSIVAGGCAGNVNYMVTAGHNLVAGNCPLDDVSDQTFAAGTLFTAVLHPLANNGGLGDTYAVRNNSPAVDAAADDTCLPTDQLGTSRPQGNACDVGAVESSYSATPPSIPTNTINVTTTSDDMTNNGNCTLREAVEAANTNTAVDNCAAGMAATSAQDIISLPAGIYMLSIAGTLEDNNQTGDLDVLESVHVQGAGAGSTTINAAGIDRIFHIDPNTSDRYGIDFSLSDTTLSLGNTSDNGGAIYLPHGSATIQDAIMVRNSSSEGGAIATQIGHLWVADSEITSNSANTGGGVDQNYATANWWNSSLTENEAASDGGGVANYVSVVQLVNTDVLSNTADNDGGGLQGETGNFQVLNGRVNNNIAGNTTSYDGGGIYLDQGWLTLRNSEVNENETGNDGGGIYRYYGGYSIFNSQINDNTAQSGQGGGIYNYYGTHIVNDSEFKNNTADDDGGGLFVEYGFLLMQNSTIENNFSNEDGGGLFNYEAASDIRNSIFRGNTATNEGGGIDFYYYASHIVQDSLIEDNTAGFGGGVFIDDEPNLYLVNSTIAHNHAITDGGGIYNEDYDYSIIEMINSTISNNDADRGVGGIWSEDPLYINYSTIVSNSAVITAGGIFLNEENAVIQNSIVAGNMVGGSATNAAANCDDSNSDTITTNGTNVFVTNTGCNSQPTDILVSAADVFGSVLDPLSDNDGHVLPDGSYVQTHNLQEASPARESAEELLCPATDQRGYQRPYAAACDIGAVEWRIPTIYLPAIFK